MKKKTQANNFDKMSKEELELSVLDMHIKQEQETFNRYVKVLAEHAFEEIYVCGSSVYFSELYRNEFRITGEQIRNAPITKEQKDKLNRDLLPFFGAARESELEIKKSNLKYWQSLVSWAKNTLSDLDKRLKIKIVEEGLVKKKLWLDQGCINSKIFAELEAMQGKKKKVVKK